MKKRSWKRFALISLSVFVLLAAILVVHIYMVTRPRIDSKTRIMARIDVKQPLEQSDANRITAWLYQQKGVDHVLVNPVTDIVIFTYAPVMNDANVITAAFNQELPYKGIRYLPTEKEMAGGCPVASTSFSYKVYSAVKKLF